MSGLCLHGLQSDTCSLCTPRIVRHIVLDTPVLISPQHKGHLRGCEHKGDEDTDYSHWGRCTTPGAWRDLANGNPITADAGAVPGLIAESPCFSCVARADA